MVGRVFWMEKGKVEDGGGGEHEEVGKGRR
jgi:hypothetical protein